MQSLASQSKEALIALVLQLQALVQEQADALKHANKQITQLQEEIARLKSGGTGAASGREVPDWVKANAPAPSEEKKPRKKRVHNSTFHRLPPTEPAVEYACDSCPDCGRGLCGGWEYSRRQVVEIPPISVEVTDHIVVARRCGVCGTVCLPHVDWAALTGGSGHYGVRLLSLIAYLRILGRLPIRTLQAVLAAVWGLEMGAGEIVSLLAKVAASGQRAYTQLQTEIRGSPYVHADETGWREDGQNGYIWSFSTPTVRYYVYSRSRSHATPETELGEGYRGILVTDFYSGYHYYLGLHQRCWVHLLRDLHELKQKYPLPGVLAWAKSVRDLYDRAKAFSSEAPKARRVARLNFQAEALELGAPYVNACLPQSVLAGRLVRFEAELFTFVEHPAVPSENNAAERSVRPRVIARKISGGTRSAAGSKTMAVLSSLLETWKLRGEDALEACRRMLAGEAKAMPEPAAQTSC